MKVQTWQNAHGQTINLSKAQLDELNGRYLRGRYGVFSSVSFNWHEGEPTLNAYEWMRVMINVHETIGMTDPSEKW